MSATTSNPDSDPLINQIEAQATVHHAFFLGLLLAVSMRHTPADVERWIHNLFSRQHRERFLPAFDKLGLHGLPHAVACAQYHVLSNAIGGVRVEYMAESERKAWLRFRYPRWMYDGPTLCGVPPEASRGFLTGWYARNGESLNNPNLAFVCVSEDLTGEFGLCGYFEEQDRELVPGERLQFNRGAQLPPFRQEDQPVPPSESWNALRLAKANRNYAVDYVRNGLLELVPILGDEAAAGIGQNVGRLIGLQYFASVAEAIGARDGDFSDAVQFLHAMFRGMGDEVSTSANRVIGPRVPRVVASLAIGERQLITKSWQALWAGALRSYRIPKVLTVEEYDDNLHWVVSE